MRKIILFVTVVLAVCFQANAQTGETVFGTWGVSVPTGASRGTVTGTLGLNATAFTVTKPSSGCYGYGFQYKAASGTANMGFGVTTTCPVNGSTNFGTVTNTYLWTYVSGAGTATVTFNVSLGTLAYNGCVYSPAYTNPIKMVLTISGASGSSANWQVNQTAGYCYVPAQASNFTVTINVTDNGNNPVNRNYTTCAAGSGSMCTSVSWGWFNIPVPTVSPSITSINPICDNGTITLANGAATPSNFGISSYSWTGGVTSAAAAPSFAASGHTGQTFSLQVTDNIGCVSTTVATGAVTVRPPFSTGTVGSPGAIICTSGTPSPGSISVTPTGGTGPNYNIVWSITNMCTAGVTTQTNNNVTTASYTIPTNLSCQQSYSVAVTDLGSPSCASSTVSNTVYQNVYPTVSAPPTVTNTAPAVGLCSGSSATVTTAGLAPTVNSLNCNAANDMFCVNNGGSYIPIGANWTVESWFKYPLATGGSGWWTLFRGATGDHHIIIERATNLLGTYDNVTGFKSSGYNISGVGTGWHHIAAVGTGSTTSFYIDGNFVGSAAFKSVNAIFSIGNYWGGGQPFGEIDNVRIWNAARNQQTIRDNMYLNAPTTTNLVAGYRLDGNITCYNNAAYNGAFNNTPVNATNTATTPSYSTPAYYTYTWASSGSTTASFSANPTTLETVTVTVTNTTAAEQTATATVTAKIPALCTSSASTGTTFKAEPVPGVPTVNGSTTNFSISFCGSGILNGIAGTNGTTCRYYKTSITPGNLLGAGTTSPTISTGGTYFVTTYNATTTCESTTYVQVTVTVTASFSLTLTPTLHNTYGVSCNGGSDGVLTAAATSSAWPVTYSWSTGALNVVNSPTTSNAVSSLAPGSYTVNVSDASGCGASASITISAPPAISVSVTPSTYAGFGTNCNGSSTGTVSSSPTGGTGTYSTYSWTSTPAGFTSAAVSISSLVAKTYNLTVIDNNGCTASASTVITDPAVINFTTTTGYACSGATYVSASVTINASGGASGNYNYRMDGGAWQGSNTFSGLANSSTHSFQVQDATYTTCLSGTQNVTITFPANGTSVGDCNFIYVTPNGDAAVTGSPLGSKNCPSSLLQALYIYSITPARNQILMAQGTYTFNNITLSIPANVTIDGGYDANTWVKSTGTATILNINPPIVDNATYGAGYYIGMQPAGNGFSLKDLTINVQAGNASGTYQSRGRSVYGIYLNGQTGWNISRCTITTGNGSAGLAGAAIGGSGGGNAGGAGGSNGNAYAYGCSATGTNGSGGSAGVGGASGGAGGSGCTSQGCNWYGCDANGCNAQNGSNGAGGATGAAGTTPANTTGINVFYVPVNGTAGSSGGGGGGGGRGGEGASGTCCTCTCGPYYGTGGYGGNGGAGGVGGNYGYGGGASVPVYAYGGSGTIKDCLLSPGGAGAGGSGGAGQAGAGGGGGSAGGDNTGYCDGGKGGYGGNGGNGGTGGAGGAGATGLSQTYVATNGASITPTGTTIPANGIVTANWYSGCTNSEITLTKTSGSSWAGISTDPAFELDYTSSTGSYSATDNTIIISYPTSSTTGDKDITVGSTVIAKFIKLKGNRLVDPATSLITAISNPCPAGSISLTNTLSAGQTANVVAYSWQVTDVASPTVNVYTSSAANPGTVNPPVGGWVLGHTYQVRFRLQELCCGWSIPMYRTFTIPSQLAQVTTITQSPSGTVCAGQAGVTYTASAVAGATSYTWTVTGGGSITAGQGTATITVTWGPAVTGATVSVVPKDACTPSTDGPSKTITFNVNGAPTTTITPGGPTTFCSPGSVTMTAGASTGGGVGTGSFTYAWSPGTYLNATTGSIVTSTPLVGGTYAYTVVATESGSGCTASDIQNVTMNTTPAITNMSANACTGVAFTVTPVDVTNGTVPAGTTYSWSAPSVAGITGTASGSGASNISGTLTNTTSASINVVYTVTPLAAGPCTGATFTVTITVVPKPVITNYTVNTCSATPFTVSPVNATPNIDWVVPTGTTYSWAAPAVTTGTFSGGAAGSAAANITGNLTSTNTVSNVATYTVTPTFSGCAGSTFTIAVNIGKVEVNASAGVTTATCYPTVKAAFDNINNTVHQGAIDIKVKGSTTETATALLSASSNGTVKSIAVTASGTGYASGTTTVTITGGGGWGATAVAVISATKISGVTITNGGTGYTSAPAVNITSSAGGTGATATASVGTVAYTGVTMYPTAAAFTVSGSINGPLIDLYGADNVVINGCISNGTGTKDLTITNTNTGTSASNIRFINAASSNTVKNCVLKGVSGATAGGMVFFSRTAASATCALTPTWVASINAPSNGGYGYLGGGSGTFAVTVTGTGTGAAATATVVNGVITSISLDAPGSGYTAAPTLAFAANGGGGTGGAATAVLNATSIASYTITNGGWGYGSVPALTISGAGGGSATPVVSNGVITDITAGAGGSYTAAPTITIAGPGAVSGNDNNTIDNCDFTNSASTRLVNGVYAIATVNTSPECASNTVSNCNFYDWMRPGTSSFGVQLNTSTNAWTISGNKFWETSSPFAPTAAGLTYRGIYVSSASGNNFQITNNTIGGATSTNSGTWTVNSLNSSIFYGIDINSAGTTTPTSIQGNTVKNFNITSSNAGPFIGIRAASGALNIGNTGANTIDNITVSADPSGAAPVAAGSWTTNLITDGGSTFKITGVNAGTGGSGYSSVPSVVFTSSPNGAGATGTAVLTNGVITSVTMGQYGSGYANPTTVTFTGGQATSATSYGINVTSTGTVTVQGNTVSGVNAIGATDYPHSFVAINKSGAGTTTISNNIVGSTSVANSIQASSAATSAVVQSVHGILSAGSGAVTVSGNTVANLTNAYAGIADALTRGISTTAGVNTITGNTVNDIATASGGTGNTANASCVGIQQSSASAGQTISNNTVYNISNTNATAVPHVYGLSISSATTGTNTVAANFVRALTLATSSSNGELHGIRINSGVATYSNNIVSLGTGITGPYKIYGIYDVGAATFNTTLYHNTVYLGGTATGTGNNTAALYSLASTNTRNFRNNIFSNARGGGAAKHYAAYFNYAVNTNLTLDYNDYYVSGSGGTPGFYNGADVTSGSVMVTGKDASSLNLTPSYVSAGGSNASDYTPNATTLFGVTGTGITTDYFGSTRSVSPPKMGAIDCPGNPTITASVPGSRCGPGTVNLSVTASGESPAANVLWYTAATGGTALNGTPSLSFTTPSISVTTTYYAEAVYNGCRASSPRTAVVATVDVTPVPTAGSNITTCTGTAAIAMTGATATGAYSGNPTWSGGGGLGNWTQNANPALATFTPTAASGSFTATLTLTGSGGCTGTNPTSTRIITWGTQPVATAGSAINSCTGTSAIAMTGATATGTYSGTPTWSGGGGLGNWVQNANPALATFTPTGASGSFTATLTLTGANGCVDATSTRVVTWGTQAVATAGSAITTCTGTAAIAMTGATATGTYSGTPTWSGGAGSGNWVQNANPALATFTPTVASGSFTAVLTLTGTNGCVDATSSRVITWGTQPVATAGSAITTCTGTAAIAMTGATATGTYSGTPTWSGGGGLGNWVQNANPALATFTPTAASGSFSATLTLTGTNGCVNSTSSRTITWGTQPVATAGSAITTCTGTAAITMTGATATGTYSGTPTWSGGAGSGNWAQNANPALATFTPTVASGSFTATLTLTGANGCVDATSTRVITWGTQAVATAGSAITTCTGTAAIAMTGATATGTYSGTPTWSGGGGLGNWSQNANPALATFTPTAASGSFTAVLTLTGTNGCVDATSSRVITWGTQPVATAGSAIATCTGTAAITMTGATATGTYSGTPTWSGGGGLGNWSQNANPALATFTPTVSSGSFTATLTLTGANGCVDATSTRTIAWGTQPVATAGSAISVCTGAAAITMTGATATGTYSGTPTWSGGAGSGNWSQNANPALATFTPTVTSGSFTATLTLTGANGCVDATSTRTITWAPSPDLSNFTISATTPICANGITTVTVNSTSLGNGTYTVTYNLSNPNSAAGLTASLTMSSNSGTFNTAALASTGTTTVTVTSIKNSFNCSSSPGSGNTANVVVNTGPTVSITNAADVCVGGSVTLNTNVTGGAGSNTGFVWERSANAGGSWTPVSSGTNNFYATSTSLIVGSYLYRVTLTQSGSNCSAVSSNVSADVKADPSVTPPAATTVVCVGGSDNIAVTATGGTPGLIYEWEYDNTNPVVNNTPGGFSYTGEATNTLHVATNGTTTPGTQTYWVKVYATGNGCDVAYSVFADFTVNPVPTVSNPTPATQAPVCSGGTPATLSVTATGTGTINYQWYKNTSNSTTGGTPVGTNSASYTPAALTGTTWYYCAVSQSANGCGPVTTAATAVVTVGTTVSTNVVVDECMNASLLDKYYVLVTGSGGTAPYTYSGAFYTSTTNQGIYEVDAGTSGNTFTIQDVNGCSATTSPVNVPAGRPTDIVLSSSSGNVSVDCWDDNFNKWVTFRDAVTNNAIIAIHDNHSNLGLVTVNAYKDATAPVIYNNGLATNCTWTPFTAMRRHFKVTTSHAPTTPVDVMLFFTDQEYLDLKTDAWNNNIAYPNAGYACSQLDDVYNFNQLYVTKYSGPNEDGNYLNNVATPTGLYRVFGDNAVSGNPLQKGQYIGNGTGFQSLYAGSQTHHYVKMTVTEFSEFWIHGSQEGEALPVEMIFLQADAINNAYIQLTWATAIEINNKGFEVERSVDGQNWTEIGWVDGHNNTTAQTNYSFNDMNVARNIVYYYRLKQVDNDLAFEYTDIVSARLTGDVSFSVKDFVPNPTMDKTSLIITTSKDQELTVSFYDVIGRKVMESTHQIGKGASKIEFNMGRLAAGTYTAVISSANEVYTKKVVLAR